VGGVTGLRESSRLENNYRVFIKEGEVCGDYVTFHFSTIY